MNLLLTGATGTAGSAILAAALASPRIAHVTILGRRAPPPHAKLTALTLPSAEWGSFDALSPALVARVADCDAVVWALGAMRTQVDMEEYARITRDWTLEGARALGRSRFVYITSMGVSQDPGWAANAYVRVKGETEAGLRALGIEAVFVRPGGILPTQKRRPELIWYNRVILDALSYVWPSVTIHASELAEACLRLALGEGWELRNAEGAVENADLKRLAAREGGGEVAATAVI
ncbi:NAD(P)-binding protein [Cutaneotrichosporon oleaginosum]|uniref:NAD(P)-binding protein n=1 Tax=Cutaneotrichosporon oleaginosum TaxID=879819 RepID=A0A0J0XUH9_9TREE|nr:NAD(P)-binding protein [Cutaneotrichosporon oleaginosum]KLT44702.1 NAD(P)-binding protein [Cutaneotrichosporon oleaginosum]TXT07687.1 hypothetical protein COLE_04611 [Cutaneotrichosporon oleaginosum]